MLRLAACGGSRNAIHRYPMSQPTPDDLTRTAIRSAHPASPDATVSLATREAGNTLNPPNVAEGTPLVPGYEVEGILGRGGMGIVYKARHLALNRTVALKMILHASHAGDSERIRFTAEAQAVARLQHPNIVQVYEVGEHDGLPFCAL